MSVWIVVGGQFGSEGKGKISALITQKCDIAICVRCGGPNSGHSFDYEGKRVLLRQLPCGFVNQRTRLLIPAGGIINLELLYAEIKDLGLDHRRVGVDYNALLLSEADAKNELRLDLYSRLSSTQSGTGYAVSRRVLRGSDVLLAKDSPQHWLLPYLVDVSEEVHNTVAHGDGVLIEGTQGSGLSLYHSRHYPKATSRDTNAAGFASEVGISPRLVTEVVLVFRTFPIRVSGEQAGPLRDEISWSQLALESKSPEPLTEFTSVTQRVRRVGRFDWSEAERSIRLNSPSRIAVNFLDHIDYSNRGLRNPALLTERTQEFIARLSRLASAPVAVLGTGPALRDSIL